MKQSLGACAFCYRLSVLVWEEDALLSQAIGARNLLRSVAKQREAQQQQLEALLAEKRMQLERWSADASYPTTRQQSPSTLLMPVSHVKISSLAGTGLNMRRCLKWKLNRMNSSTSSSFRNKAVKWDYGCQYVVLKNLKPFLHCSISKVLLVAWWQAEKDWHF